MSAAAPKRIGAAGEASRPVRGVAYASTALASATATAGTSTDEGLAVLNRLS